MYREAKLFFIKVITPLHAGSGEEVGFVDLPIQREKHTGYPKIEGSSLKGSIREIFNEIKEIKNISNEEIEAIFGPEEPKSPDDSYASAIGFTDASILLFPVKSVKDVFAYTTSADVLEKFIEKLKLANFKLNNLPEIPPENSVPQNSSILLNGNNAVLEEYLIEPQKSDITTHLADFLSNMLADERIKNKLIILEKDVFKDFVEMYTEVITRTKIKPETGTVKEGGLFTEEYLPSETVLYSLVLFSPLFTNKIEKFSSISSIKDFFFKHIPDIIQIGGNATIGKGIVELKFIKNEEE